MIFFFRFEKHNMSNQKNYERKNFTKSAAIKGAKMASNFVLNALILLHMSFSLSLEGGFIISKVMVCMSFIMEGNVFKRKGILGFPSFDL